MATELQHEEPTGRKGSSRMARTTRRQVRKRLSAQTRKEMGDPLAGDGDRSRRQPATGPALRGAGRRIAERSGPHAGPACGRRSERHEADAVARAVPDARGGLAGSRVADVQALHAEEPSLHPAEAPAAALWRPGDRRGDAPGGSAVRGSPGQQRVRAQDDGSHPRRAERGAPDGGQMGSPREQPGPGRGAALARERGAQVGAHDSAGESPGRGPAAAGGDHGGPGAAVGPATG